MIGTISIKHLVAFTHIGYTQQERANKQGVILSIVLWVDMSEAIKTDNLEKTINYSEVSKKILAFTDICSFHLLETLGNAIADICLEDKRVQRVEVEIAKPYRIPSAKSVGVTIAKKREAK